MSTVQVEERVKKKLFSYAAKLQAESGRKISLSEAIDRLLDVQSHEEKDVVDKKKLFSLFGILRDREEPTRTAFRELRDEEEKSLERKYARATRKSRS